METSTNKVTWITRNVSTEDVRRLIIGIIHMIHGVTPPDCDDKFFPIVEGEGHFTDGSYSVSGWLIKPGNGWSDYGNGLRVAMAIVKQTWQLVYRLDDGSRVTITRTPGLLKKTWDVSIEATVSSTKQLLDLLPER